ncbi:MAG: hypothetical protein ABUL42_00955 [Terricaulis silvestris]
MSPRLAFAALACTLFLAMPASAQQLSRFMSDGIPGASYVARYSPSERAVAARAALGLPAMPRLHLETTLSPNAPYASNGARMHAWKPSFDIGTEAGGEIGVNFWNLHTEGHVNVGFTPHDTKPRLLDCRFVGATPITYKIYRGVGENADGQGQVALAGGHFFLMVPSTTANELISVELWPTPVEGSYGLLGCDISIVN